MTTTTPHRATPWLIVTVFLTAVLGLLWLTAIAPLIALVLATVLSVPMWVWYFRGGAL